MVFPFLADRQFRRLVNRVLDGTVDLAWTGQNTGDDSCVLFLCQDNMVIANHYLNLKQKNNLLFFRTLSRILLSSGKRLRTKEMDIFLKMPVLNLSSLNVVARMNDLESINFIVNGLGFSILSARSVVDLHQSRFFCFHWIYQQTQFLYCLQ